VPFRLPRSFPAALALLLLAASLVPAAADERTADERQRFTVIEENDSLPFNGDKHYTQGLRLSYLAPPVGPESFWSGPFEAASTVLPWMDGAAASRTRRYAIIAGQSLFTPKDKALRPPDPADRPYAGWLYGGVSLLQETDRRILDHVELQLGMIGPAAAGKATQNEWHQFIGVAEAEGWSSQIQNEFGGVLEVERKWRMNLLGGPTAGLDVVPELGGVAGNVFTYGKAGALLRIGTNLGADYGPARITPALSGTDYVDT
jgi:lipid A 3-O-deacylase